MSQNCDDKHLSRILCWIDKAAGEGIMLEMGGKWVGADELLFDWFSEVGHVPFIWPDEVKDSWGNV